MSTLSARPMSLWGVEFGELYARHLCRHSQPGINVVHLIALFGVWFGVYSLAYWLTGSAWVPVGLAAAYWLALAATGAPPRVLAATAAFLALFIASVLYAPELPWWAYALLVPVCYKVQSWSHRLWNVERDMTEFDKKYRKGRTLFVVLLLYEVPILLNYLLFGRRDWAV